MAKREAGMSFVFSTPYPYPYDILLKLPRAVSTPKILHLEIKHLKFNVDCKCSFNMRYANWL